MTNNISKLPESSKDNRAKTVRSILNDSSLSEELAIELYEAWTPGQNDSQDSDSATDSDAGENSDDDDDDVDDSDIYRVQY